MPELSISSKTIDVNDQNTLLISFTAEYNKVKTFISKIEMKKEEMDKAVASGKFPLITYLKTVRDELVKIL
jgi:hypothetical protein